MSARKINSELLNNLADCFTPPCTRAEAIRRYRMNISGYNVTDISTKTLYEAITQLLLNGSIKQDRKTDKFGRSILAFDTVALFDIIDAFYQHPDNYTFRGLYLDALNSDNPDALETALVKLSDWYKIPQLAQFFEMWLESPKLMLKHGRTQWDGFSDSQKQVFAQRVQEFRNNSSNS